MLNEDGPAWVAYEMEACEMDDSKAVLLGGRGQTAIDTEGGEGATGLCRREDGGGRGGGAIREEGEGRKWGSMGPTLV